LTHYEWASICVRTYMDEALIVRLVALFLILTLNPILSSVGRCGLTSSTLTCLMNFGGNLKMSLPLPR
jgi:hypothetical protein